MSYRPSVFCVDRKKMIYEIVLTNICTIRKYWITFFFYGRGTIFSFL
jgi:hypothetical protein